MKQLSRVLNEELLIMLNKQFHHRRPPSFSTYESHKPLTFGELVDIINTLPYTGDAKYNDFDNILDSIHYSIVEEFLKKLPQPYREAFITATGYTHEHFKDLFKRQPISRLNERKIRE